MTKKARSWGRNKKGLTEGLLKRDLKETQDKSIFCGAYADDIENDFTIKETKLKGTQQTSLWRYI